MFPPGWCSRRCCYRGVCRWPWCHWILRHFTDPFKSYSWRYVRTYVRMYNGVDMNSEWEGDVVVVCLAALFFSTVQYCIVLYFAHKQSIITHTQLSNTNKPYSLPQSSFTHPSLTLTHSSLSSTLSQCSSLSLTPTTQPLTLYCAMQWKRTQRLRGWRKRRGDWQVLLPH